MRRFRLLVMLAPMTLAIRALDGDIGDTSASSTGPAEG